MTLNYNVYCLNVSNSVKVINNFSYFHYFYPKVLNQLQINENLKARKKSNFKIFELPELNIFQSLILLMLMVSFLHVLFDGEGKKKFFRVYLSQNFIFTSLPLRTKNFRQGLS